MPGTRASPLATASIPPTSSTTWDCGWLSPLVCRFRFSGSSIFVRFSLRAKLSVDSHVWHIVNYAELAYDVNMKPQIVLDTNVLVAALRSHQGAAFRLLSLLPTERFAINLSVSLVLEYEEVLHQQSHELGLNIADITDFLDFICARAICMRYVFSGDQCCPIRTTKCCWS